MSQNKNKREHMEISVIIPTYNRPDFLKSALDRCSEQTLLPAEVIIGDDSKNDDTELWIKENKNSYSFKIKYLRNKPSLGQGKNVGNLISNVETPLFILLHDDDLFLSNCLNDLYEGLIDDEDIDVIFGKQYLMNDDGELLKEESVAFNVDYSRIPENAGKILNPMIVTIKQMMPSNSYLMKTDLAKAIGYGNSKGGGRGVDFHFSFKLSEANVNFKYLDTYMSCYRLSEVAVSKGSNANSGYYSYKLIEKIENVSSIIIQEKDLFLKRKSPVAVLQAIKMGKTDEAFRIYFSKFHRSYILSLGGIKRLLLLLQSSPKFFTKKKNDF